MATLKVLSIISTLFHTTQHSVPPSPAYHPNTRTGYKKGIKIMLVINLAKWNNQKILGFYPLHNDFKYLLHLSLLDSLYSGKKYSGCEQNGCGEKSLKSTLILTEGNTHILFWFFFFLLGQRKAYQHSLNQLQFDRLYLTKHSGKI